MSYDQTLIIFHSLNILFTKIAHEEKNWFWNIILVLIQMPVQWYENYRHGKENIVNVIALLSFTISSPPPDLIYSSFSF